jgi:hypothetical protein
MSQVRLKNSTGGTSKIGSLVKLSPNSTTAFMYANLGDSAIIGTISESVPNGNSCLINQINTVDWKDVMNKGTVGTTTSSSGDIDGGFVGSVYTSVQLMDGGNA